MFNLWRRPSAQRSNKNISRRSRFFRSRLTLEPLEDRVVPTSVFIPVQNHRDLIYDAARNMLDITTSYGRVERYSVPAQSLLNPFPVGTVLNGADITMDGNYLYVTEQQTSGSRGIVHKVDLNTGAVTNLLYTLAS